MNTIEKIKEFFSLDRIVYRKEIKIKVDNNNNEYEAYEVRWIHTFGSNIEPADEMRLYKVNYIKLDSSFGYGWEQKYKEVYRESIISIEGRLLNKYRYGSEFKWDNSNILQLEAEQLYTEYINESKYEVEKERVKTNKESHLNNWDGVIKR